MAKKGPNQKVKLVSTAGTGYCYYTRRTKNLTEKLVMRKYDPVVKKHVEFKEDKIKKFLCEILWSHSSIIYEP